MAEQITIDTDVRQLVRQESTIGFGRKMNALSNQGLPWLRRDTSNNQSVWSILPLD